jgi:hypothetical protein
MKRLILTVLAAGALTSASAQLFSPESVNGALLGTFIGGIAGSDCHHGFSGTGAAIGAGVGLLVGAVAGEVHRQNCYASQPYYYSPAPVYAQPGYGYGYAPTYVSMPAYVVAPPQPKYAAPRLQVCPPATNAGWGHQIPDAPRVPDAPTF